MVFIQTSEWKAEIAVEEGGNLIRLQHRASGVEILRFPKSIFELRKKPAVYGIPVLFPPNRIADGKFNFQGREYKLPVNEPHRGNHLHGLVLGKPWSLCESGTDYIKIEHKYAATAGYPHNFEIMLIYYFLPEKVVQECSVTNHSGLPMPFGLGFHTAFKLPPNGCVRISAAAGYWEILKPRYLPSGKLISWAGAEFSNNQAVSCHCPVTTDIMDGQAFRGAILEYADEQLQLKYEIDEKYRHWCLWNDGGGKAFFCVEPMSCMVNAPNLSLPAEVTGMQFLDPSQTWTAISTFSMEKSNSLSLK